MTFYKMFSTKILSILKFREKKYQNMYNLEVKKWDLIYNSDYNRILN